MKKYKIMLSALLVFSLFNIQMNDVNAKGSVVIDGGTAEEHTIPADVTGSIEPGLADGFVQTNTKKLNFEKVNLEGISLDAFTMIRNVKPLDDGTFLVLINTYNTLPSTPAEQKRAYDAYLLIVNLDGKVLRSLDVANGENGEGMSVVQPLFGEENTGYEFIPKLELIGDTAYVMYRGAVPGNTQVGDNVVFATSAKLDGTNSSWTKPKDYPGAQTAYTTSRPLKKYSEGEGYVSDGDYLLLTSVQGVNGVGGEKTDFKVANMNFIDQTQSSDRIIQLPTHSDIRHNENVDQLTYGFRTVDEVMLLPDGSMVGRVIAQSKYLDGHVTYSFALVLWNADGSIKSTYYMNDIDVKTAETTPFKYEMSTESEIYFLEDDQFLRKMDTSTGEVTTVKEFPAGSTINFVPNDNGGYLFYGVIADNSGVFSGYGNGPGTAIGEMDSNFNVISASVVECAPNITMELIDAGNGNFFTYGNLTTNDVFANEPTADTNGAYGNGWIDKPDEALSGEDNDVYVGRMKNVDDYAPAIKVGDAKTVNVEELSAEEVEKELLASVEVYDSFETNPNNPNNSGLTAAEMKSIFEKRLNANPDKLEGPIDWKGLGLDTSKVGYNEVKFFITDTNNQITADSKIVNVIKNSTEENGAIAIDANNFHMNLADVASLDDATSKTNAQVIAWDMGNGDDLIGNVTVDAKELAAIQSTKEEGIFDLTFTVTKGSETVSNTVKVFVGGTYDPTSDIVIFAHNFSLMLKDAASYPGTSAVAASEAKAYIVKSNTELDSKNISADVATLNAATKIGPYPVELTYTDGTLTAKASVIANVFDKTVVEGDHDAIGAKNIVFDVAEVKAFSVDELRAAIIARSGVTAWDTLTGEPVAYEFDESVVLAEVGEYSLTFITENGTEKTIIVYVAENPTCDNGCDSVDATEFITAQDFYLTPNEVAALTEEKVIVLGNAKATNIETGENLVLSADYGKIRAEAGSYDVTYTTESGLEKTVKATVGNNLVDDNGVALAADNVVMWDYEVAAFNEDRAAFNDDLVIRSKARAWLIEDNSTLLPVTADSAAFDMADLTPYSYSVVYNHENTNVEGGVLTTDARLTIKGKNTVVGEEDAIDANDFALTASEVEGLTDEKVIELANARAWLIADGSDVEITEVDFSLIEAKKGVYDVTFTSAYGTSTTVQAFVGNKNRPTIKDGIVVFADDYTKKVSDLPTMTLTDHIEAADASAIDQDTYEELEITHIDISNVLEAEGQYPAEFGVDKANVNARSTETQIIKADSVVTIIDDSEAAEVAKTGMTYFGSIIAMLILGLIVIARMGYRKIRR